MSIGVLSTEGINRYDEDCVCRSLDNFKIAYELFSSITSGESSTDGLFAVKRWMNSWVYKILENLYKQYRYY
jgi:hypothetical protein